MTRPGIEPWSPGPLANTLPSKTMSWTILNLSDLRSCSIKYSYRRQKNLLTLIWFQVFLSYTNNYMVSNKYLYLITVICLLRPSDRQQKKREPTELWTLLIRLTTW